MLPNKISSTVLQTGTSPDFRNLKNQLMSLFMFKSSSANSTDSSSVYMMIYSFVMITIIERVMMVFPAIFTYIQTMVNKNINKVMETNSILTTITVKPKTSSITIDIHLMKPDLLSSAILDLITNHKNTKSVYFANNMFSLNDKESILLDDEKEIYSKLLITSAETSSIKDGSTQDTSNIKQVIEIYSHQITTEILRRFLNELSYAYHIKVQNKLGDKLFYFNALPSPVFISPDGTKDYTSSPPFFTFTVKPFSTNRKFENIVGEESSLIKKRVDFFLRNEKWYNNKGVPYSLGLLLSGSAGTGKTSSIKATANETQRHIFNIHFNDDITKKQMEELFFSETIYVRGIDGKLEQYTIPMNKRVFVFEDVDCQNDIVLDRQFQKGGDNTDKDTKKDSFILPEYMPFVNSKQNQGFDMKTNVKTHAVKNPLHSNGNSEKLTLSMLLNLLDGILETPGRIIIMTSNYPERLDKALIRPGRIDLICKFTKCTNKMIIDLFQRFYDVILDKTDVEKINGLTEYQWSPAELTKIMFENFHSFSTALTEIIQENSQVVSHLLPKLENIPQIDWNNDEEEYEEEKYNSNF